ncbi:KICSTOR complex protein SZT2-like isoform X2 [Paramacrobiotus metropolitanus]|uniref:KICSTOR complex protein SZT2-like isoform X2 n=1 Tax=Paramacrobiotus metropolitanus TaxID=2943436 RepID=UPI0024456127|nr:KICSTOR complex protein SZT2-like isoform X2 [Paramacrobiotus metropolitanus]
MTDMLSDPALFGEDSAASASRSDDDSDPERNVLTLTEIADVPANFAHLRSYNASRRCSDEDSVETFLSEEAEASEEAGQVFVMMEGMFRVSRNTRAQWFLRFLNKTVVWDAETEVEHEDKEPLEIISCIPRRPLFPVEMQPTSNRVFKITPLTAVTFLSKTYRLVFALDLTPSMATVSLVNGSVAFDELFSALQECLTAISQPTVIPGTNKPFSPKVFVTVLAHAPFLSSNSAPVIVKGFKLLPETLADLLQLIRKELTRLEGDVVTRLNEEIRRYSPLSNAELKKTKPFMTMDMTLANILRKCLLSVQLLPDNSCGHIVVVTDGILDFPDITVLDQLLSQLRTHTISVSFIRVACPGQNGAMHDDLGYLCNADLMEFIARTTTGAYVEYQPSVGELDGSDAGVFQTAFFTWSFQRGVDAVQNELTRRPNTMAIMADVGGRMMRQFLSKAENIDVSLGGLLSIRLREGFTIKSITFSKGDTHIDIVLSMPWKPEINIDYQIGALWPPTERGVSAEIYVEAPYEFLLDLTVAAPNKNNCGPYRLASLKRFRHMIQSLEQTEQFLIHFEQFKSKPSHYTIPEVIREGMPVFYLSPDNPEDPVLCSNDLMDYPDFTNFWRPICVLDSNLWHKWLHVHRISLLLEHDKPLSENIFSSRRVSTIRCSFALNQLRELLQKWCQIVLVENHSYIRFITENQEDSGPPKSFFIIRMAVKLPCVALRMAFLGGTSGNIRHKVMSELEQKLAALTMQVKDPSGETNLVTCCWRFAKPVEKMLIQYRDVPGELTADRSSGASVPVNFEERVNQAAFPVANPLAFQALSRFLHCRRYVWQLPKICSPTLSYDVIGRVLTVLAKMRLREQFRFASTSGGVFNLVREVEMTDPARISHPKKIPLVEADKNDFLPCIAQYIIFPPCGISSSLKDEEKEESYGGRDQKYSVAVEIWLEPQYGVSMADDSATSYLNALKYQQIPDKMHDVDKDLLSTFLTFEMLASLCGLPANESRKPWTYPRSSRFPKLNSDKQATVTIRDNAEMLAFPFDMPSLLAKCSRTRMTFCSFRSSFCTTNVAESNDYLFHYFSTELRKLHTREVELSEHDCHGILRLLGDGGGQSVRNSESAESYTEANDNDSGENFPVEAEVLARPSCDWRCFVKVISDHSLVITLVPVSYVHLKRITQALDMEEIEGPNIPVNPLTDDSSAVSLGEGDSENDDVNFQNRPAALPIPVYIFTCTFSSLIAVLVEKKSVTKGLDFDYDLTKQFNVQYERPLGKRISESRGDDSLSERTSLRSLSLPNRGGRDMSKIWMLCGNIEDAFAKGFVQGIYKSLHLGYVVDPYDIQQATDAFCAEVPVELDLTEFLRCVCPHFKRLIRKRRTSGNSPRSANSVVQHLVPAESHIAIKAEFIKIISRCLKKIHSKPDTYFFYPPGYRESGAESASSSEGKRSEDSEATVEFRANDSGNEAGLRESVSGFSEAGESGRGFFEKDPDSMSLNTGCSDRSVFGSDTSESAPIADLDGEDGLLNPLFVTFMCVLSAGTKHTLGSSTVQQLPTCLSEVFSYVDTSGKLMDFHELRIRLDVLCLSLPEEIRDIHPVEGRVSRRTISGGSSMKDLRGSDSDLSTINEEQRPGSSEDYLHLPAEQHEIVQGMLDNLRWHLQDEIAYTLSVNDILPTEENLRLVMDHVKNSKNRSTCTMHEHVLRFVYNAEQSFQMFVERFERVRINNYRFVKEGEFYYLIKAENSASFKGSPLLHRRQFTRQSSTASEPSAEIRRRINTLESQASLGSRHSYSEDTARRSSLPVYPMYKRSHGIVTAVNNEDIKAFSRLPPIRDSSVSADEDTLIFHDGISAISDNSVGDYGYDAGSSESDDEEDNEGSIMPNNELPGFWLILNLTKNAANIYCHVRECEVDAENVTKNPHRSADETLKKLKTIEMLTEETLKRLKAIAKVVNQELLLKDMCRTLRCNNLVEPETLDEDKNGHNQQDVFRSAADDDDAVDSSYLEASLHYLPGYFSCDMVFQYEFVVHPRLRQAPGKSEKSPGIQALMGLLSKFAVINRRNMFVIQETGKDSHGAIFYIRMHERGATKRLTSMNEDSVVPSRIGSVGKDLDLISNTSNENTPRSVTFEDGAFGEHFNRPPMDTILLEFYGISPVPPEITNELILALQNRLDEQVLSQLIVTLTRNVGSKFTGEDVKFLQPDRTAATEILDIKLPGEIHTAPQQVAVFHYLLQNLGSFLHGPKYSQTDPGKHFHYLDPATEEWKIADDEASFFTIRPHEKGGMGFGFIYVQLLPQTTQSPLPSENVNVEEMFQELVKIRSVKTGGNIRFLVWEKGNVDRAGLLDKLRHSVRYALSDFWMEHNVCPALAAPGNNVAAARTKFLRTYLHACCDIKAYAFASHLYLLPMRHSADIVWDFVLNIINGLNLGLILSATACLRDAAGVETHNSDFTLEPPKSLREFVSPLLKNLPPGNFAVVSALGLTSEEDGEKRSRSTSVDAHSVSDEKTKKSSKKFLSRTDHHGTAIASRTRLLFIELHDTDLTVFFYNFSPESQMSLEKAIGRLLEWQHERYRLLNNMLLQKCGVFQPMKEFESHGSLEYPMFHVSPFQVDYLINYANFPSKDNLKNMQNPKHQMTGILFEATMDSHFPGKFFADEANMAYTDPVLYHGKQFCEIRTKKRRSNDVRARLRNLYDLWHRRGRQPISEEVLSLLKMNAKPVHFCASPLMFDPQWRRSLGTRFPDRQLLCSSPIQRGVADEEPISSSGSRSRHNSGILPVVKKEIKPAAHSEPSSRKPSGSTQDQQWHSQIRNLLMQEYVEYLQYQGFTIVFSRPASPPRHVKKSPQSGTRAVSGATSPIANLDTNTAATAAISPRFTPSVTYLQRCVPGGMILLELFFEEPFFFCRMFAVDRVKFSDDFSMVGNDPDKAIINLQREVDRLKVAMHMHSFLYDFHLRSIAQYVSGNQMRLKPGYHIVSFFDDFGNYYQKAPSYAKSCFQTGAVVLTVGSSIPAAQLYNYILAHDKQYDLYAVPMDSLALEDSSETSFALASRGVANSTPEGFECTYIVYADTHEGVDALNPSTLHLRYYIILTSTKDGYSTDYLEERFGSFKTLPPPRRPRMSTIDVPKMRSDSLTQSKLTVPENLDAKASLVAAFPNFLYIGYFSRLETELNTMVENQRSVLEAFIKKALQRANSDCIRDTLWQRLSGVKSDDEHTRRSQGNVVRSRENDGSSLSIISKVNTEQTRSVPKLSVAEFEELVNHVYRLPIISWDSQLSIFFQGNPAWLNGLLLTIKTNYWETQRHFVTHHGASSVEHLVIVSPLLTDLAVHLALKKENTSIDAHVLSRSSVSIADLKRNATFIAFMEGFVNVCCFHMWKNVLST